MELALYINSVLLVLTISYGFAFGIRNWILRLLNVFSGGINQLSVGKILDGMFLTVVLYFCTIGLPFIKLLKQ